MEVGSNSMGGFDFLGLKVGMLVNKSTDVYYRI